MIELLYRKQNTAVELAKMPFMPGKPKVFELTTFKNVTKGNLPRLQSTYFKSKGKRPLGSNNASESAWTHFNKDLMDRIRQRRANDVENNLRAI